MREILFRAYDKTMKRYKPFDGEHDTMLISRDGKVDYYNLQNGSGFDEYILEQFTGLVDKNGKKIFEGDIVNTTYDCGPAGETERIVEVVFGSFGTNLQDWIFKEDGYLPEIIGNIHDNPELLT